MLGEGIGESEMDQNVHDLFVKNISFLLHVIGLRIHFDV